MGLSRIHRDDQAAGLGCDARDRGGGAELRRVGVEEIQGRVAVDHGLLRRRNPAAQSLANGNRQPWPALGVHAGTATGNQPVLPLVDEENRHGFDAGQLRKACGENLPSIVPARRSTARRPVPCATRNCRDCLGRAGDGVDCIVAGRSLSFGVLGFRGAAVPPRPAAHISRKASTITGSYMLPRRDSTISNASAAPSARR